MNFKEIFKSASPIQQAKWEAQILKDTHVIKTTFWNCWVYTKKKQPKRQNQEIISKILNIPVWQLFKEVKRKKNKK
jgi:hypothetical protein